MLTGNYLSILMLGGKKRKSAPPLPPSQRWVRALIAEGRVPGPVVLASCRRGPAALAARHRRRLISYPPAAMSLELRDPRRLTWGLGKFRLVLIPGAVHAERKGKPDARQMPSSGFRLLSSNSLPIGDGCQARRMARFLKDENSSRLSISVPAAERHILSWKLSPLPIF